METKVTVTADNAGNVITKTSNPIWGYIRVEQTRMVIDENGFARMKKLSALIPGTVADLHCFGWEANQKIEGKIIIKESLTPFNKHEPEKDLKVAGISGVVCQQGDSPIYRKHFFNVNAGAVDQLLEHTNTEEIKAAYALMAQDEEIQVEKEDTFKL